MTIHTLFILFKRQIYLYIEIVAVVDLGLDHITNNKKTVELYQKQ